MITKILLTLAVIVACMMLLPSRKSSNLKTVVNPETIRNRKMMRNAALAFMLVMVIAATAMIYFELGERNAVVTVNVINTQSGAKKSYRVQKNDIHGDGFTTTDGVQVFVAEIERIEIETR